MCEAPYERLQQARRAEDARSSGALPKRARPLTIGRRFFSNTLFNWLGTAAATAASIVLTPYLIRYLDAESFGIYQISRNFIMYMALLDAGILGAVMRFSSQAIAAREDGRVNELANSALLLYLAVAAAGLLLSALAAHAAPGFFRVDAAHAADTRALFLGLGVWWALTMLACPAKGILIGHQRYGLLSLINAGSWILTVALIVGMFMLGHVSLTIVGLAFIGGAILQFVSFNALARWIQPTLRWTWRCVARPTLRILYGFGMWNMLFTVSGLFLWSTDSIIIGRLLGPEYVALYAIPFMLIQYGRMVGSGFVAPLIPVAAGQVDDRAALQTTLVRATRLGLIMTLAGNGLLVIVVEDLIRLWVGAELAESWVIYAYLMASFWAVYAQRAIYHVLLGAGDIRAPAAATLAATAGTVVLKIVALDGFGLGIEAVALLNLALVLPVMLIYVPLCGCRLAGMPLGRFYREAYLGPILAFVPVAGLGWLAHAELAPLGLIGFVVFFGLMALAYLGLASLALARDERRAVVELLMRTLKRLRLRRLAASS